MACFVVVARFVVVDLFFCLFDLVYIVRILAPKKKKKNNNTMISENFQFCPELLWKMLSMHPSVAEQRRNEFALQL